MKYFTFSVPCEIQQVFYLLGEEGMGGDDQDLDDIVIRQLRQENEKLKDELNLLREVTASDTSVHEEMSAILRDRINDLLLANADLEKEVVRLRYSPQEIVVQDSPESELELLETKVELNSMAHENELLKLAIGKERYGPRQVPVEQKEELNILKTENEELKNEVRKFRYGVHLSSSPFFDDSGNNGYEPLDNFDDEGYNTTDEFFEEDDLDAAPGTDFITLTKLEPVLPPVILMGGKVPSHHDEDMQENDEVEVEDEVDDSVDNDDDDDDDNDDIEVDDYFKTFKSYLKTNFDKKLGLDVGKVGQVIDEFKKNAGDLIPDKVQIQQIKESAEELGSVLKEKWDQLDIKEEKKKVDKLAKTIIKALNKAKDAISEEFAPDKELWSQRLQRIQQGFQSKWDEVTNKFLHDEEKFKTCDSKKPNSR